MMKVYDMVTCGLCDPAEIAPPYGYEAHAAQAPSAVPALQLQPVQFTATEHRNTLPPSLRRVDIERFLESCGD